MVFHNHPSRNGERFTGANIHFFFNLQRFFFQQRPAGTVAPVAAVPSPARAPLVGWDGTKPSVVRLLSACCPLVVRF